MALSLIICGCNKGEENNSNTPDPVITPTETGESIEDTGEPGIPHETGEITEDTGKNRGSDDRNGRRN